ncbi:MAG TPA: hypothetical protein VEZ90_00590 [Blastocatellia bacterium]|nr:hypothetical protein [Blastocatellia bacterium]
MEILGGEHLVTVHSSTEARDPVFVARMEDGGLISYRRSDGSFVHTLNTIEGFNRKLGRLGIPMIGEDAPQSGGPKSSGGGQS